MKASFPNEMALLPQACRVGSALRADCTDGVAAIAVAILLGMLLFIRVYTRRRLGSSFSSAEHLRDDIGMVREFLSQLETARSSFIDNRHVTEWMDQYSPVFSRLNGIPKGNLDQPIKLAVETFERLRANVDYWNSLYIQEASVNYDALFGHLDARQREACIADEVAMLVVAGAGSGKTSTIQKKAEFLVRVMNVAPDDILLLSFTNKAADEMTERLHAAMPDTTLSASTFHKFGLDIVRSHRSGAYDISDPKFCEQTILHALSPDAMTDDECRGILRYFAFCLNPEPTDPSRFRNLGDFIDETRTADFQTIRGMVDSCQHAEKTSFNGETVRSFEELEIANWLFLNGIRYEYEKVYDHPIPPESGPRKHRAYKPDFYLPDYDIWLEHFGVDKNGEPPPFFSPAQKQAYKEGMVWKRRLHEQNHTRLVESYSWWHQEGRLTENLWEALRPLGVRRHGVSPKPIWEKYLGDRKNRLVREFARLASTFISLAKSNRIAPDDLTRLKAKYPTDGYSRARTESFLDQVSRLYRVYEGALAKGNALDFHDMINEATDRIREDPKSIPAYRYVIIDEFQDVSPGRAELIKAVVEATGAKLFCVGDDWQSIYRFAGTDISLFTRFQDHFGFTRTIYLENTYRNSAELLDIAGGFIMKNKRQLRKKLRSSSHYPRPVVCIPYGTDALRSEALLRSLNDIANEANGKPRTVLLLGRHNQEAEWAVLEGHIKADANRQNFTWLAHPELKISYMTVHKAKGLEADFVILLNFKNDLLGFPNRIADDPVLSLLLSDQEDIPFAEERRVFYVALTRTRNRIYILTPGNEPSIFLKDLPRDVQDVADEVRAHLPTCPKCGTGRLLPRKTKNGTSHEFYGCSNFPRCDYTLPVQRVPLTADTPRCSCGGFLVPVKNPRNGQIFLGCTEYGRIQPYRHIQRPLPPQDDCGEPFRPHGAGHAPRPPQDRIPRGQSSGNSLHRPVQAANRHLPEKRS